MARELLSSVDMLNLKNNDNPIHSLADETDTRNHRKYSTLKSNRAPIWLEITLGGIDNAKMRRSILLTLFSLFCQILRFKPVAKIYAPENKFRLEGPREISLAQAQSIRTADEKLGFEIRLSRYNAGLTQAKLAELAGISRCYLTQVERGLKHPSQKLMVRLNKALGHPTIC